MMEIQSTTVQKFYRLTFWEFEIFFEIYYSSTQTNYASLRNINWCSPFCFWGCLNSTEPFEIFSNNNLKLLLELFFHSRVTANSTCSLPVCRQRWRLPWTGSARTNAAAWAPERWWQAESSDSEWQWLVVMSARRLLLLQLVMCRQSSCCPRPAPAPRRL